MTKQLDWLELAIDAAENARKLRVSGNDPRADDWDDVAAARAAVAQAAAQTRLADNSDRIADALERIVAALHSKDGMNVADNLDFIANNLS